MAEEIILRRCLKEDIESVLDLWKAAEATGIATDTRHGLRLTINSGVSLVLLAQSGERITGSIIGTFDGWRGNIYRLAVHPEYRRRGIARRLVSEAETWLRERGAKPVTALVEKDHPWATGFWDSTAFVLEPLDLRYARNL